MGLHWPLCELAQAGQKHFYPERPPITFFFGQNGFANKNPCWDSKVQNCCPPCVGTLIWALRGITEFARPTQLTDNLSTVFLHKHVCNCDYWRKWNYRTFFFNTLTEIQGWEKMIDWKSEGNKKWNWILFINCKRTQEAKDIFHFVWSTILVERIWVFLCVCLRASDSIVKWLTCSTIVKQLSGMKGLKICQVTYLVTLTWWSYFSFPINVLMYTTSNWWQ